MLTTFTKQIQPSQSNRSLHRFSTAQLAVLASGTQTIRFTQRGSLSLTQAASGVSTPTDDDLKQALLDYSLEAEVEAGRLVVAPTSAEEIRSVTFIVVRAFATALETAPTKNLEEFVTRFIEHPPKGVLLTARLYPNDKSRLKEGWSYRVVGSAAVSFEGSIRQEYPDCNPPEDQCFVTNLAVDPTVRRQGIGRMLLKAGEELAKIVGQERVYLHVWQPDKATKNLYLSMGYEDEKSENALVAKMKGRTPITLMRKAVL